jgi:hypothetical protein
MRQSGRSDEEGLIVRTTDCLRRGLIPEVHALQKKLSWASGRSERVKRTVISTRAHCGTRVPEGMGFGNLRVKKTPSVNAQDPSVKRISRRGG